MARLIGLKAELRDAGQGAQSGCGVFRCTVLSDLGAGIIGGDADRRVSSSRYAWARHFGGMLSRECVLTERQSDEESRNGIRACLRVVGVCWRRRTDVYQHPHRRTERRLPCAGRCVVADLHEGHSQVKATAQVTKAPAESLNLLQAGRGELAFAPGDVLSAAWRGDEEAGFRMPLKKLRGLSATYDNYIQIVARADSGIRTVADLKGKRVSVGTARSATELSARAIVRAAGLSYKDLAKVEYLPFGQSVELMKERQLDATLQSAVAGRRTDPRPRHGGEDRGRDDPTRKSSPKRVTATSRQ